MKNLVIALLIAIIFWLAAIIIRLENFRYATSVGFCTEKEYTLLKDGSFFERYKCLKQVETRTNRLWHLFYAMKGDY